MKFREWKFEDILSIFQLEKEIFSDAWTYRMFADAFASKHFYGVLAEEDGAIVGYACSTVLFENAEVDDIAVGEEYRGQGIGKELLKRLEKEALERGAVNMLLEVRVSNAPAMMMYLKEGYRGIYARGRYYPDGEDALVMKKSLI